MDAKQWIDDYRNGGAGRLNGVESFRNRIRVDQIRVAAGPHSGRDGALARSVWPGDHGQDRHFIDEAAEAHAGFRCGFLSDCLE